MAVAAAPRVIAPTGYAGCSPPSPGPPRWRASEGSPRFASPPRRAGSGCASPPRRDAGFASPPRRDAGGFVSPPRFTSPPRAAAVRSEMPMRRAPDAASHTSLHSGALGPSYSLTSLGSTDSGPGVKAPPKTMGSVLGQGQALLSPTPGQVAQHYASGMLQAATPLPPRPSQVQQAQWQLAPSMVSAASQPAMTPQRPLANSWSGNNLQPASTSRGQQNQPPALFGRMIRSPAAPGSPPPWQGSVPSDCPAQLPTADASLQACSGVPQTTEEVPRPKWVIEEVIDFGIPEEEEVDMDSFVHPRWLRGVFSGSCVLWNCTEEEEERDLQEHKMLDADDSPLPMRESSGSKMK